MGKFMFTYNDTTLADMTYPSYAEKINALGPQLKRYLDINDFEYLQPSFKEEKAKMDKQFAEANKAFSDGGSYETLATSTIYVADMLHASVTYGLIHALIFPDFIRWFYEYTEKWTTEEAQEKIRKREIEAKGEEYIPPKKDPVNIYQEFIKDYNIALVEDSQILWMLQFSKWILYLIFSKNGQKSLTDPSIYRSFGFPVTGNLEREPLSRGPNTTLVDEKCYVILRHELGLMFERVHGKTEKLDSDIIVTPPETDEEKFTMPIIDEEFVKWCCQLDDVIDNDVEILYKSWSPVIKNGDPASSQQMLVNLPWSGTKSDSPKE